MASVTLFKNPSLSETVNIFLSLLAEVEKDLTERDEIILASLFNFNVFL